MEDNPTKKRKVEDVQMQVQFVDAEGNRVGVEVDTPGSIDASQLQQILNSFLEGEDPHLLFVAGMQVDGTLHEACSAAGVSVESVVPISYHTQSVFRVSPITRASSNLEGHTESLLVTSFAPDGSSLATGAGDATVRIWDLSTETPQFTMNGHTNWVLVVAWAPNGAYLASAGMDGKLIIWNPETSDMIKKFDAHNKHINALAWIPMHVDAACARIATASKDKTVRVFDVVRKVLLFTLTTHTASVTKVLWGGEGYIYTASQDKMIKIWKEEDGRQVRSLTGHGHWVNQLSVSTEWVIRTGSFDPFDKDNCDPASRYAKIRGSGERLVSCSDDFTLFLWQPGKQQKPLHRMTGHQGLVSQVSFSPDGNFIISAGFDKCLKLWDGFSGKLHGTFRGHVGAIYQVAWSPDCRMFISGSQDSTIKLWNLKTRKLQVDLPGHADQVYSIDWSPGGTQVASGGRDRMLNLWRH